MNDVSKILTIALVTLLQACSTPANTVANPAKATATTTATTPAISSAEPLENAVENTDSEPVQVAAEKIADRPRVSQQPEYCAPQNYRQFFWNFVKDNDIQNNRMRVPYASAEIKVRDYNNPQKILEVVRKEDYQGFKISAVDYTMVYDDRSITDPNAKARLKLDFTRRGDDVFRVNYVRAEFETNPEEEDNNGKLIRTYGVPGAYIFVHRNGCWNLTAEERTVVSGTDRMVGSSAEGMGNSTAPSPKVAVAPNQQETQIETADYPEISEGMSYGTFRRRAADKGWKPDRSAQCSANVNPGSDLCEQLPELQSCDQYFCQMVFNRGRFRKLITLKVYGGNNDENALGRDSKWRVISWSIDDDNSQP